MSYVFLITSWLWFLIVGLVYGNIYSNRRHDHIIGQLLDDIEEMMKETRNE